MHIRILTLFTILLFSCGKDVVEITDIPLPNQPEELFEVNLIGYVKDQNENFVDDVDLFVNDQSVEKGNTSFFKADNVLIGNTGQVLVAEKQGFLPIHKRIYNHQTIEDVIVNVSIIDSPESQVMTPDGGEVISENGAILSFGPNAVAQNVDVVFYSSINADERIDFDPLIITDDGVEILDNDALLYIGTNGGSIMSNVSLEINGDAVSNPETAKLYKYNESLSTWEENGSITALGEKIHTDINSEGWWAIGDGLVTVFGSTKFDQPQSISNERIPLVNTEVKFTGFESGSNLTEHLYTSEKGIIYKYFPIDVAQKVELDGGDVIYDLDEFSSSDNEALLELDQQLTFKISGESYDCNLEKSTGYVAAVFGDQYVIKRLEAEIFDLYISSDQPEVDFDFFDDSENLLVSKKINTDNITSGNIKFVACAPLMEVKDDNSIIQNFDQCKVRVKPVESFIVGEGASEKKVFVAFRGNETGIFEGLVYAEAVESMDVTDIESEVTIDIRIYDLVSETIAGTLTGAYKSGEAYSVKFIGNIEN